MPLPGASPRGSIGGHAGGLAFSPPALSEEGGLEGVPTDSDSLVDATPPSPPSPPPAPAAPLGHQPGVGALAAAAAMRVASVARFRRAATDLPVASALADSTTAFSAAAAPVGSRGKAPPTPTRSPAGTHKVLRSSRRAAARPLRLSVSPATTAECYGMSAMWGGVPCTDHDLLALNTTVRPSATPVTAPTDTARTSAAVAPAASSAANTVSDAPANE